MQTSQLDIRKVVFCFSFFLPFVFLSCRSNKTTQDKTIEPQAASFSVADQKDSFEIAAVDTSNILNAAKSKTSTNSEFRQNREIDSFDKKNIQNFHSEGLGQRSIGPGTITTSIEGSPHDFSNQAWNLYNENTYLGGQICQPCHTPHNADIMFVDAPLWNHHFSTSTYEMYRGENFGPNGLGYSATVPDGMSKLCLSCHDGSVALGSYSGQIGTTYITGGARLDLDMTNEHPISFIYDSLQAGGVWDKTHIYSGTKTVANLLDANNKMQCTSCHGVHNNSMGYFLKMRNVGSELCLACHTK